MPATYSLSGRTAIVTGAAQGIGKAIVEKFLEADAEHVVAVDVLPPDRWDLAASPGRVAQSVLDVTDEAGWEALVAATLDARGSIDILANNAGILAVGLIEDTAPADFRRVMEVNVTGVFLGMRAVVPAMKRAGRGAIVNTSSMSGISPSNGLGAYGASKFAVRSLSRTAAMELAPFGIRVNSVHPGAVDTPMTNPGRQPPEEFDKGYGFVPMGRGARAQEIANGVLYLASDAGSYCNGTELRIDGGILAGYYMPGLPGTLS